MPIEGCDAVRQQKHEAHRAAGYLSEVE
jgi:hypothetical protein